MLWMQGSPERSREHTRNVHVTAARADFFVCMPNYLATGRYTSFVTPRADTRGGMRYDFRSPRWSCLVAVSP